MQSVDLVDDPASVDLVHHPYVGLHIYARPRLGVYGDWEQPARHRVAAAAQHAQPAAPLLPFGHAARDGAGRVRDLGDVSAQAQVRAKPAGAGGVRAGRQTGKGVGGRKGR